jgi:hypothetical protein
MYTESNKKACAKYYVNNQDKVCARSKTKYQTDPEYRERKLAQMKEYRERNKLARQIN